ncbi:Annexin, partial [Sesbania bispinosa]
MATLIAPPNHSPLEDAEALRKAVKGWGADGKGIIAILGHRNATQRTQIREAYHDLFQEDLIKRLESELSGDFERAMYRWILEPAEREALLANIALRNANKNFQVIVEISCVLSPEELFVMRRAYHNRYKRSLEEDLLVGLVSSFRYGGNEINARLAQSEADVLHEAIKDKNRNHEEVIRILTTRSKTQLVATFNRYRDDHGIAITK